MVKERKSGQNVILIRGPQLLTRGIDKDKSGVFVPLFIKYSGKLGCVFSSIERQALCHFLWREYLTMKRSATGMGSPAACLAAGLEVQSNAPIILHCPARDSIPTPPGEHSQSDGSPTPLGEHKGPMTRT